MTTTSKPLIDIKGLTVDYILNDGFLGRNKKIIRVLNKLNLQIEAGETLGIVGESGCGKSTLGNSILRLLTPTAGEVIYKDSNIMLLGKEEHRRLRRHMQMVFQNPFSSLNPRMTILNSIAEPLKTHTKLNRNEIDEKVEHLLQEAGLGSEHKNRYPHQMSGGQLQRVAMARALALNPSFLVLDEPTSALDIPVQAQIINLLKELQNKYNLTYMFISHDLSVVKHISDRIAIMYLGEIVELGKTKRIFESPLHPYTKALLSATPVPDPAVKRDYITLEGHVPSPVNPPSGCRFHTRCPMAFEKCKTIAPSMYSFEEGHQAACHLIDR